MIIFLEIGAEQLTTILQIKTFSSANELKTVFHFGPAFVELSSLSNC